MAASSTSTSPNPVDQEELKEDRIGSLPDLILLHILSFLPTVDSVRTSILSRRWRTLWTSVDILDFDDLNPFFFNFGTTTGGTKRKRESNSKFVKFVGKVLSFHHTPTLHKLRLSCYSQDCPLKDWVRTAVTRGVQTLDLCLRPHPDPDRKAGWLPPLLFISQSLVDLRLDLGGSSLILPGTLALVGLRRMHLCRVKFCDDHSTCALFSCSTALTSLALKDCDYRKLGCLEISCSSLHELAIESWQYDDGLGSCKVKIAAPHLSSFMYCASVAEAYIVEPLLCVEYLKFQFRHFTVLEGLHKLSILDRANSFFLSVSAVRNLDICPMCTEALLFKEIPFHNLNVLRMAVQHLDYGALGVVLRFLLFNPKLRALTVEVWDLSVLPSSARKKDFLELLGACFQSRNGVLERVEIRSSVTTSLGPSKVISYTSETVLELVRVLLGSQAHLKKLILSTYLFCSGYSPSRSDAVMEKVLSFPKRSRELAVAFILLAS